MNAAAETVVQGRINPSVSYKACAGYFRVMLEGRRVGQIVPVEGGWHYVPNGDRLAGETFPTFALCCASLEGR